MQVALVAGLFGAIRVVEWHMPPAPGTMLVMCSASFIVLPSWLGDFVTEVVRYPSYTPVGSPVWIITRYFFPWLGAPAEVALQRKMETTRSSVMQAEMLHEFGGAGPVVHLAHANGFPPGSYRPLAETLIDRYRVIALPSRALWPGSRPERVHDWRTLTDDLIQGLDELQLRGILGIGHSIGGVLTMWAAIRRPNLFRAVVLIEPVILPPVWLLMLRVMRRVGLYWRQPLVQGALRRKQFWPSQQACYESYRNKPLFANWPEASLRTYVEAGTRPRADGQVELVYSPEWEARIFATAPVDVWHDVPKLRTPTLVIRGGQTNTFRPECQACMERLLPGARYVVISGAGHLVPLERPTETGAAIRAFLESF